MPSFILFLVAFFLVIAIFSILFINLQGFLENRNIHQKFIYLGDESRPTEILLAGKIVSIYTKRSYLRNEVRGYNSQLFYDTLYINSIPVIGVECFERIWHISREVYYNSDYERKEINLIIEEGVKKWHKKIDEKVSNKKSILNKRD